MQHFETQFFNLLLPLINLPVVGIFLAVLLINLLLYEQLLLCHVLQLGTSLVKLLSSESLVCCVAHISVGRGDTLRTLTHKSFVERDTSSHIVPQIAYLRELRVFVGQALARIVNGLIHDVDGLAVTLLQTHDVRIVKFPLKLVDTLLQTLYILLLLIIVIKQAGDGCSKLYGGRYDSEDCRCFLYSGDSGSTSSGSSLGTL